MSNIYNDREWSIGIQWGPFNGVRPYGYVERYLHIVIGSDPIELRDLKTPVSRAWSIN